MIKKNGIFLLALIALVINLGADEAFDSAEPELTALSAVIMDYYTGRILYDKEGEIARPPASMTKLVSLYLGCQAVEEGVISLDTTVQVTKTGSAFSRPDGSSLMLLEEGQTLDYLTLLQGIAVSSGNDGAYQLAELLAGTPEAFVDRMNLLAYSLGYGDMHFVDPDGWSEENQVTPASYAAFARDYVETFPWALEKLHAIKEFTYPGEANKAPAGQILTSRTKKNTNLLLGKVEGVDGLKSGYIDESGFNMAVTAKRGETRLIAVVMGIFAEDYRQGLRTRAIESENVLEYGFANWETRPLNDFGMALKVYKGEAEQADLIPEYRPLWTLSDEEYGRVEMRSEALPWLEAPLEEGSQAGTVAWYLDGEKLGESVLVTVGEIKKGSFFHNFIDLFEILFYKVSHREEYKEMPNEELK